MNLGALASPSVHVEAGVHPGALRFEPARSGHGPVVDQERLRRWEIGGLRSWAQDSYTSFGFLTLVSAILLVVALATGRLASAFAMAVLTLVCGVIKWSQGAAKRKAEELKASDQPS